MNEPWKLWVKPKGMAGLKNGLIPAAQLTKIPSGGTGIDASLWSPCAESFLQMFKAAKTDGITLKSISKQYRPLAAQEALFYDRMDPAPTTRKPPITRRYKGRVWWLRPGKAPVATPGTSIHGWGCAVDLNVKDKKTYAWLCTNAPKYGWYLAGPRTKAGKPNPNFEAWHWQWSNR